MVSPAYRQEILWILHFGCPGILCVKRLARGYVWWPRLYEYNEHKIFGCATCQLTQNAPPQAPVNFQESATRPWCRLHVYFTGSFQGRTFLLVADAFPEWLEVRILLYICGVTVVSEMRRLFSTHRILHVVASDNGSTFASEVFHVSRKREGAQEDERA